MADIIRNPGRNAIRLSVSGLATFDFEGGDLTSRGGVVFVHELCRALGVGDALRRNLARHARRAYDDADVAYFRLLSLVMGEARDRCAEWLERDPAFALVARVPSQETLSRRLSAMGEEDAEALRAAVSEVMDAVARCREARDMAVVDVDSTLLATFGRQEEASYNTHYDAEGYHPLVATDVARRELLAVMMRGGTAYCSNGAGDFVRGVLADLARREPGCRACVRGDSGFASPQVYEACEEAGAIYVVRMKNYAKMVEAVDARLAEPMAPGVPRVVTGDMWWRCKSWDGPRRIVYEVRQEEGQLLPQHMLVVTNSEARCKDVLAFYRDRGETGQLVGEYKDFAFGCVGSRSMSANDFRCQLALLAHCLVAWTRSLCLPGRMARQEPATVVRDVLRFAARVSRHARGTRLRIESAYPLRAELCAAEHAIWELSLRAAAS